MSIKLLRRVVALSIFGCFSAFVQSASAQVTISVSRDHQAVVRTQTGPSQTVNTSNDDRAVAGVGGGERSECTSYGRASSAQSEAGSRIIGQTPTSISIDIRARSYANGAHFRTCDGCLGSRCLGNHGNDRYAEAIGSSVSTINVEIVSVEKQFSYILTVGMAASQGNITVSVQEPDGKELPAMKDDKSKFLLTEKARKALIRVRANATSRDDGGCCSSEMASQGVLTVAAERAPILEASFNFKPFISQGKQTTGFANVVAIGIDDKMHCSGTFVGTRTVITAAHCLYGYENRLRSGQFNVRFGSNFHRPDQIFKVSSGEFPSDSAGGFAFNPSSYEDDVAILYIDGAPSVKPAKLYAGMPTWDNILKVPVNIIIVGFGYNVINGDMIGLGFKREAAIKIDSFTNRTMIFQTTVPNTCAGDSGGPSFVESASGDGLLLAAITSGGDKDCTSGRNSRFDAYRPWIEARIK
jgi:secreted trypsin-like serine protease